MVKTEKRKTFDAVETVRELRDAHYEQTKSMTQEERLSFYQREGRKAQDEMERFARKASTGDEQE